MLRSVFSRIGLRSGGERIGDEQPGQSGASASELIWAPAASRQLPDWKDAWHALTVRTAHGDFLAIEPDAAPSLIGLAEPSPQNRILLFRSVLRPTFGLLGSFGGASIDLYQGKLVGPLAPVMVLAGRYGQDGAASFRCPVLERYLTAGPRDRETGVAVTAFDRVKIDSWERFPLEPFTSDGLPVELSHGLSAIASLLARGPTAGALKDWSMLASDRLLGVTLPCLVYLLPREVLVAFSGLVARDRECCRRVSAALPPDYWSQEGLPSLSAWLVARASAPPATIGPSHDGLTRLLWEGNGVTELIPPSALVTLAARSTIEPTRRACILATARNEGIYLLEWIAHHRALGFEHFFIYSNNNTDGSDMLLKLLSSHGLVTWIRSEVGIGQSPQLKAYTHALSCLPHILDFHWTAVLDLDEFVCLDRNRFSSISDFLALSESRQADAVALSWLVFTPSGQNAWNETSLRHRCQYRLPTYVSEVKNLVQTRKFGLSLPHQPVASVSAGFSYLDTKGRASPSPGRGTGSHASFTPTDENIWVAHYHLKSCDEYLWKVSRTAGFDAYEGAEMSRKPRFLSSFLSQHGIDTMQLDTRVLDCAPDYEAEHRRILALDGVAEAHENVKAEFRRHLGMLRERILAEPVSSDDQARLREMVKAYAAPAPIH